MKIVYTKHAEDMIVFRKLRKTDVKKCIIKPDKVLPTRENKKIYLKDFGQNYLKVIVVETEKQLIVITLYWLAKRRLKA